MHALVGHHDVQVIRRSARQGSCQRIPLLAIKLANSTDVTGKMALLHELGHNGLVQRRRLPVHQIASTGVRRQQHVWHHGVTNAQSRKEGLVERPDINYALVIIEPLKRRERRTRVSEFARVVVLDDERAALAPMPAVPTAGSLRGPRR